MTRPTRNGIRTLLLAATVAFGLSSGAVAYWMSTGSGNATTVLASPDQLTLSPGTPEAQLQPGDFAGVAAVATNSNPYFVQIDSLVLDTSAGTGGFDVDAGHGGCDPSVLHLAPQNNGGTGWRVPPRVGSTNGTQTIDLTAALSMDSGAASACQGASFTVHLMAGS
jgi:hypothetical protein